MLGTNSDISAWQYNTQNEYIYSVCLRRKINSNINHIFFTIITKIVCHVVQLL